MQYGEENKTRQDHEGYVPSTEWLQKEEIGASF